ncbi:MAG: hypothetical protein N2557_07080 [Hydrogenophilus sp.]|nr:hypothetical protein [Hydrogenophilus sp.]
MEERRQEKIGPLTAERLEELLEPAVDRPRRGEDFEDGGAREGQVEMAPEIGIVTATEEERSAFGKEGGKSQAEEGVREGERERRTEPLSVVEQGEKKERKKERWWARWSFWGRRRLREKGLVVAATLSENGLLALRLRRGERAGDRPTVLASVYRTQVNEEEWGKVWEEVAERVGWEKAEVFVTLPPSWVQFVQSNLPSVPEEERAAALRFRLKEGVDLPLDDMVVDWVETPGLRRVPNEPPIYCAVASRRRLKRLTDAIVINGMQPVCFQPDVQGIRQLLPLLQPDTPEDLAVVVAVFPRQTRLIAARWDRLYLYRNCAVGLADLDRDPHRAVMALGLDIQRMSDFFEANFSDPLPRRYFVVTANEMALELADALHSVLPVPFVGYLASELVQGDEGRETLPGELLMLAAGAVPWVKQSIGEKAT